MIILVKLLLYKYINTKIHPPVLPKSGLKVCGSGTCGDICSTRGDMYGTHGDIHGTCGVSVLKPMLVISLGQSKSISNACVGNAAKGHLPYLQCDSEEAI